LIDRTPPDLDRPECKDCPTRIHQRVENIALERKYKEALKAISRLSRTDTMTGLANKDRMYREIENHLEIYLRDKSIHCAVIFVDIDNFKEPNDRSHQLGDQLLVEFANFLQAEVRPGDIVARFGGDEFFILAPCTTKDEAERLCGDMQAGLLRYRFAEPREEPIYLTASMGVASTSEGLATDVRTLVETADSRMSEKKFQRRASSRGK
jgi:diguanylate cyclase (GGDEF)-like protein